MVIKLCNIFFNSWLKYQYWITMKFRVSYMWQRTDTILWSDSSIRCPIFLSKFIVKALFLPSFLQNAFICHEPKIAGDVLLSQFSKISRNNSEDSVVPPRIDCLIGDGYSAKNVVDQSTIGAIFFWRYHRVRIFRPSFTR